MAETLSYGNGRYFWGELKRMGGCNASVPSSIDSVTEDADIAELFASKFSQLYNSVPYNNSEMETLVNTINKDVVNKCSEGKCSHDCGSVDVRQDGNTQVKTRQTRWNSKISI